MNVSKLDDDVVAEEQYVEKIGKVQGVHSLVAKRMSKYYGDYLAVNRVSFSKCSSY